MRERSRSRIRHTIYLIELTEHKKENLLFYPFIIWRCFERTTLKLYIEHIETCYGKIKAIWKCDSEMDAVRWRKEILEMRGQEDLI